QVLVVAEALGHVADLTLDGLALGNHVMTEACAAAVVGAEQAAEGADERRLAAPVWTKESVDLPLTDLEIDMVDDGRRTEALGDAVHIDGEFVGHDQGPNSTSTG